MVVVQHMLTQHYLQSFADWSAELNDAWMFHSMSEAVSFCELMGLKDVQVVVAEERNVYELPVPARSHALPAQFAKVIPVVLPRADSRPN